MKRKVCSLRLEALGDEEVVDNIGSCKCYASRARKTRRKVTERNATIFQNLSNEDKGHNSQDSQERSGLLRLRTRTPSADPPCFQDTQASTLYLSLSSCLSKVRKKLYPPWFETRQTSRPQEGVVCVWLGESSTTSNCQYSTTSNCKRQVKDKKRRADKIKTHDVRCGPSCQREC